MEPTEGPGRLARLVTFVRERPFAVAVVLLFTVAGAALAHWYQIGPADMHPLRRVVGGAVAGACFALFPLGKRLLY